MGPDSAMGSSCRIECIFFSEFHPTLGPKITYQVPCTLPGLGGGGAWGGCSLELSWLPGGVVVHPHMPLHSQITLIGKGT